MYKKAFKYIIAATILISLIAFIVMTDIQMVMTQVKTVGNGFVWIMLCSFLGYLTGSLSWQYCFKDSSKISLSQLFYIRTVGELITLFNPTNIVAGEASKYHLLKNTSFTKEEKLDAILLSRIILILSQIVLAILCCFWISYYYENQMFMVCGIALMSCLVIFYFVNNKPQSLPNIFKNSRYKLVRLCRSQIINIRERLSSYTANNKKRIAISYLWSTIHWLCGALEIYIILLYLGLNPLLMHGLIVDTGVVVLKSAAGFVPGQIGVEELSNKLLLSLIGFQGATIWLTVSVLRRAKQLCWILISAVLFLMNKYLTHNKQLLNGNIICDA